MAQINIASSHRMMTAVFVAITYQRMSLEANFSALERMKYTSRLCSNLTTSTSTEKLIE